MSRALPDPLRVTGWAVWSLPQRLLTSVLLVEMFAAVLLAADIAVTPFGLVREVAPDAVLLLAAGVLHAEVSLRIERVRRRVTDAGHIDLSSVWTFAATLLFPPVVACGLVAVLYLYLYLRVWRRAKVAAYRQLFSTATVVLAVHAAAATLAHVGVGGTGADRVDDLPPILAAIIAYTAVNTCLVVGAIVLSSDKTVRQIVGPGDEVVLEVATLSFGAILATAFTISGPATLLFAFPPLLVLHRAVLVKQLERAVNTDSKTNLLTSAAWQRQAMTRLRQVERSGGSAGMLVLDLDHFKRVNDTHGHLAGDLVLAAVGRALRAETREQDVVGRFGGEEFVILLPRPEAARYDRADLAAVAERIRRHVDLLRIEIPTPDGPLTLDGQSVSIGGAVFPEEGREIDELIAVADSALYAAKRAGRNLVRLGPHRCPPTPETAVRDGETPDPLRR